MRTVRSQSVPLDSHRGTRITETIIALDRLREVEAGVMDN